jgi:hypothetical protein
MDDTEKTLLFEFVAWLSRGDLLVRGVSADTLVEEFVDNRECVMQRRRDFMCRLMVCGFAKLLVPTGQAPMEGQIMRGFVPLFVQVFNRVTAGHMPGYLQDAARKLLDRPDVRMLDDRLVWPILVQSLETRSSFLRLIAEICYHLSQIPDLHQELDRALDVVAPHGFGIVYSASDVGLVLTAWLEFLRPFVEDGVDGLSFDAVCGVGVGNALLAFERAGIPEESVSLYRSTYGNQEMG